MANQHEVQNSSTKEQSEEALRNIVGLVDGAESHSVLISTGLLKSALGEISDNVTVAVKGEDDTGLICLDIRFSLALERELLQ